MSNIVAMCVYILCCIQHNVGRHVKDLANSNSNAVI